MTPAEKMLATAEARATAAYREWQRALEAVRWRQQMVEAERLRALRPTTPIGRHSEGRT